MTGTTAPMRNHRKNDEPLTRPTMPAARPKARAIVTYAMSELAERPHDAEHAQHDDQDRRDARDQPDDELQQDPSADPQDEDRDQAGAKRGAGGLGFVHAPN